MDGTVVRDGTVKHFDLHIGDVHWVILDLVDSVVSGDNKEAAANHQEGQ